MNATEAPPGIAQSVPADARCPLCGAPLAGDQDWCLQCGTAARTRIAATPRWQIPLAVLLVAAALALAVLAGALVKLARGTGPAPAPITTTITRPASTQSSGVGTPGATTAPPSSTGASGSGASTTP